MKRTEILEQIIAEQNKIISNLEETVGNYRKASDMDEESTHDPEDFSHQSEAKDMQLRYEKLLGDANQNLVFLENEKEMLHGEIENGSVVETDKNFLFVGVSVPVFKIGDKEVISFSEEAPIFAKLKGKKIGDTVEIGDNKLIIQSFN